MPLFIHLFLKNCLKNLFKWLTFHSITDSAIVDITGKRAMLLGTKAAFDLFSGTHIDYLKPIKILYIRSANISNQKNETFATLLFNYVTEKKNNLFIDSEKPCEKIIDLNCSLLKRHRKHATNILMFYGIVLTKKQVVEIFGEEFQNRPVKAMKK